MPSSKPNIPSGQLDQSSLDKASPFDSSAPTPAQLLRSLDLYPSKALGQHFLHDRNIVTRIVSAAGVTCDDDVLEIGPGLGILTAELVRTARTVTAVETDGRLALRLEQYAPASLTVVNADARSIDPSELFSSDYLVVANLPYSVANVILRRLQESTKPPKTLTVMLQREVAKRIVAVPPDMSLLSVAVQFFGRPKIVFRVGRGAFTPPPNVDSAVLHITSQETLLPRESWGDFFNLVRSGFSQKRKQLVNTLRLDQTYTRNDVELALKTSQLPPKARPEQFSVLDWVNMFKALSASKQEE